MSKIFFNTVMAFLLVGAGVFLLLINLGVLPLSMLEIWEYFYPLVFITLGIKWIMEGFAKHRRRGNNRPFGWFWGLTFLTAGVLLLLNKAEVMDFSLRMAWQLWPLLLIYLGINILSGRISKVRLEIGEDAHKNSWNDSRERDNADGTFRGTRHRSQDCRTGGQNIVKSIKYDQPNWTVEPLDLWQGVGDYHFDFSRAFIPEEDTLIKLSGWVGDIDILLPGDVAFSLVARCSVGDFDILGKTQEGISPYINYKSADYDDAKRKLTFEFDFKVLDLHIDRV